MTYVDAQGVKVKVRSPDRAKTQSLAQIAVLDKYDSVMPDLNKNYIRLYGNYMCPFVEKARLVLHAKNIPYQNCQVSLERRSKWHYELNGGFVPFLELPNGKIILESNIIMDFVDKITGDEDWCKHMNLKSRMRNCPLYSQDLVEAAR